MNEQEKHDLIMRCLNQPLSEINSFKQGDKLIVIGDENTPFNQFDIVEALTDTVEGIFSNSPFVRVSNGKESILCHACRFLKVAQ
jgi:hypothetical protein